MQTVAAAFFHHHFVCLFETNCFFFFCVCLFTTNWSQTNNSETTKKVVCVIFDATLFLHLQKIKPKQTMFIDDKIFEIIVLESANFENLKQAVEKVCKKLGNVKIRSALISKIVIDANACKNDYDLKGFIEYYYPKLNDICKIHLQFPHDLLFPAQVECASENIETIKFDCGFLYNFNFMRTTNVVDAEPVDHGISDYYASMAEMYGFPVQIKYPRTNWYHDQQYLRFIFLKEINEEEADFKLEFDYSSFIKIYVHQHDDQTYESDYDMGYECGWIPTSCINSNHLTLTIAIGYPPRVYLSLGNDPFTRAFDLPGEKFWDRLIKGSAVRMNLLFESPEERRDFISHLHLAVTCPIIFLPLPLQIQSPNLSLLNPPNIPAAWPWEIKYSIQIIMDCGDLGCYHFHQQKYLQKLCDYVEQQKLEDAQAYLIGIHASLKLQPMMEIIEEPRPILTNFGEDYVLMRTVIITPSRKICCPPMQLMSSRAFRLLGGAEKFIQIKFRDENMQMMKQDPVMMKHAVLKPGLEGIEIAGRRFFDLARSNSMFREHGSYFYQTEDKNEIVRILKSLGKFKREPSSKTSARVGQYFTSAKEVKHKLEPHEYTVIPDYMSESRNSAGEKYCFSDGVGIISLQFANSIKDDFKLSYLPSAFQIRCLGFKGVLSIDDKHPLLIDSGGDKLVLFRDSQKKFDVSKSMEVVLGIVKNSAPAIVRFNKPLINLWDQAALKQGLSNRFDKRVNELFTANLYQITSTLTDNERFNHALKKLPSYLNFQQSFRKIWINEPFFRSMVTASALQQLRSLQYYKQISLPSDVGRSMLGIVDVTGILKERQVFVQYSKHISTMFGDNEKIVCKGKVAVSRNPIYNFGDLRILEAVDIPELHHLCDVIVFPNNGTRPHPDEMSGGDLDGDEYSVVWDPELLLNHSESATDYTPTVSNPAIDRIEDLPENSAHFRYEYMLNDFLAKISNCHLAHSDLHSLEHEQVIDMAKNADLAVNYFKSGIPADDILEDDKIDWFPDFMDKDHLPTYTSPRLLGRLHRKCDRFWNVSSNIINENIYTKTPIDPVYDIEGWEEYKPEAIELYKTYNSEIEHLKSVYGIKTEGELFSNQLGAILGKLRNFDADNSTANSTKVLIQNQVFEIFKRYRRNFLVSIGEKGIDEGVGNPVFHVLNCISLKAKKLAVAFYKVAYNDGGSLSFPWIASDALDAVWTESNIIISSNPIEDLIDSEFATDDSNINLNNSDAYIVKFIRRISTWLKRFDSSAESSVADLKIAVGYFLKMDTRSKNDIEKEFSNVTSFGQTLIDFFASISSFEFLERYPKMKFIHDAAQDTYCRIAFAPFTLSKPNIFKQRKVRGRAFVVAIPRQLGSSFYNREVFLKYKSGCSQISFRIRKQNRHHIHFFVWSQGTLQQNDALKELLTIAPEIQSTLSFNDVREYKHRLQRLKIFE